jgi:hypothetical protein
MYIQYRFIVILKNLHLAPNSLDICKNIIQPLGAAGGILLLVEEDSSSINY